MKLKYSTIQLSASDHLPVEKLKNCFHTVLIEFSHYFTAK